MQEHMGEVSRVHLQVQFDHHILNSPKS